MIIDRQQYIEELKLREQIRRIIRVVKKRKLVEHKNRQISTHIEEKILREHARRLILSEVDASKSPHRSTGINFLEELLTNIIPQIEPFYKSLTTNDEQRESFRTHIINAVENALAPEKALDDAERKTLREQDVSVDVGEEALPPRRDRVAEPDQQQFIDIEPEDRPPGEDITPEEEFASGSDGGLDETGRNVAYRAFQKVERQIVDAYSALQNEEDQKLFYDYLITNLLLYFDRFEEELQTDLPDVSTPQYEEEKAGMDAATVEPAVVPGAPPPPGGEISPAPAPGEEPPLPIAE
jgi:hypothetical protein